MLRKVFLLLTPVLFAGIAAIPASAQGIGLTTQKRVQLGLRVGVFGQDMELRRGDFSYTDPGDNQYVNHYSTEGAVGFNVAVVSRIRLTNFGVKAVDMGIYFQPEVIYSQNNYKIQRTEMLENGAVTDNSLGKLSKIRMQSVEVPLLLSLKVSILRAQFGPSFKAMFKTKTVKGDIEMASLRPMVGWSAGLSVDIVAGLVIDGRYNGQFKQLKNMIKADGTTFRNVHGSLSSWSVGIGYLF